MRPLFVGEAPSPSTDGRPGAAPLVGETGRRLAEWSGLSPAEFHRRTECVNLFDRLPRRWSARAARARATDVEFWHLIAPYQRTVVLLGRKVADAFAVESPDPFSCTERRAARLVVMPHPSGRNLFWNDRRHVWAAMALLREILGQPMPAEPSRLPL
jgi:uracil-DNA glycosylase